MYFHLSCCSKIIAIKDNASGGNVETRRAASLLQFAECSQTSAMFVQGVSPMETMLHIVSTTPSAAKFMQR